MASVVADQRDDVPSGVSVGCEQEHGDAVSSEFSVQGVAVEHEVEAVESVVRLAGRRRECSGHRRLGVVTDDDLDSWSGWHSAR
jgi:hypothetical protein